ncbi:MAG: hypothetical protein K6A35_00315 [bacterium]|nr:hypothetical protein [bacterium]
MKRLLKSFADKFVLLVSITQNDPELAKIAVENGADAVKVHLNCAHFASGTNFGSWQEEKEKIAKVAEVVRPHIPLGIVTGAEMVPIREDLLEIRQAGFDFWDLFADHIPPEYLKWDDMAHMSAVGSDWTPEFVKDLVSLGVEVIEASIIPRTMYRTRLTAADLCLYKHLVRSAGVPVIVPTQKKIRPDEVRYLYEVGVGGLAIGAVVTGLGSECLGERVAAFRKAIDELHV